MALSESEITQAYREVLRRNPDPGGMQTYLQSGFTVEQLKKDLAGSVEAQKRGIDGTRYGVTYLEDDKIPEELKDYAERYRRRYGIGSITEATLREIRDLKYSFKTDEALDEYLNGGITDRYTEDGQRQFIVSRRSAIRLGSSSEVTEGEDTQSVDLGNHLAGREGFVWLFPTTINLNGQDTQLQLEGGRFSDRTEVDYNGQSYYGVARTPKEGTGVFGEVTEFFEEDLGMGEDIANTLTVATAFMVGGPVLAYAASGQFLEETLEIEGGQAISDPLNLYSGTLYGTEGYTENIAGGADLLGVDQEDFAQAQSYGRAAAQVVVGVVSGPMGAAVLASLSNVNQASVGNQSWREALVSSAVSVGLAYAPGAEFAGQYGVLGRVGYGAVSSGVASAATQLGTGSSVDWGKVGEDSAAGAVRAGLAEYTPSVFDQSTGGLVFDLARAETSEDRIAILGSSVLAGASNAAFKETSTAWDAKILDPSPDKESKGFSGWLNEFVDQHRRATYLGLNPEAPGPEIEVIPGSGLYRPMTLSERETYGIDPNAPGGSPSGLFDTGRPAPDTRWGIPGRLYMISQVEADIEAQALETLELERSLLLDPNYDPLNRNVSPANYNMMLDSLDSEFNRSNNILDYYSMA